MESIFNFLSKLILSLLSFLKMIFRSSFVIKNWKTNKEKIFLLGNGPSIKALNNSQKKILVSSQVMVVNGFPMTDLFEEIQPPYFLITSPGFYNPKATDYNVDVRKKIINQLIEKTHWPLTCLIPYSAKKNTSFIKNLKKNKFIVIQYFNTTPVEGLKSLNHLFYSNGLGIPRPHNVLIPALINCINAGFKEINLLGAEHSWLPQISVNNDNHVLINQKHFYDEKTSKPMRMHKNEGASDRALHEVLEKFYYTFRAYHEIESYAQSKEARIYNLTPDSFVDAFERKTFN